MSCSDRREVLVSKFLFWPPWTPCCLVPDILIRMSCYRIESSMMSVIGYYPCFSDPYVCLFKNLDVLLFVGVLL